jgi:hypothetical protein
MVLHSEAIPQSIHISHCVIEKNSQIQNKEQKSPPQRKKNIEERIVSE